MTKIKKISKYTWILLAVILIGASLRAYNFHDWLRFNADQSRDAGIVSAVVEKNDSWPLLGPKAGGTNFKLGPVFYYFEIISAKVFGDRPDKMAYPDLFFSILAIPLLYALLRKYFNPKMALFLTGLFALSFYAIKYSRFAWNPNSTPFWSMLFMYGLNEIVTLKDKTLRLRWAIIVGLSVGVGIQLHTLLLIFMPLTVLLTFGYLSFKKQSVWKFLLAIIFVALLINTPQVVSEYKSGGENIKAFVGGVGTKEKKGNGIFLNGAKEMVCYGQGSVYILSSYNASETCELNTAVKGYNSVATGLGLILFIGGFVLLCRKIKVEKDQIKKTFLGLIALYSSISAVFLLVLANEISMRFYLVLIFLPFVLLGLWLEFLHEKIKKEIVVMSLVVLLMAGNLYNVFKEFNALNNSTKKQGGNFENITLKEVELAADFIILHADGREQVTVEGNAQYLFKALKSIEYFTQRQGIALKQKKKSNDSQQADFLIKPSKQSDKDNVSVADEKFMGRFTIFYVK